MSLDIELTPRHAVLKKIRFSFTDALVEPQASVTGGVPKFGNNLIIDPSTESGKANIAACLKAIEAAEIEHYGPEGAGKIARVVDDPKRIAFRKGEKFKNQDGEVYVGYEGMVGITGKGPNGGKKRPILLDRRKRPVEPKDIEDVFEGGRFGDAIVSFYCVSDPDKGGNGLFCSMELLRSHEEGETFGGGAKVTEKAAALFDDLDDTELFDGTDGPGASTGGGLLD